MIENWKYSNARVIPSDSIESRLFNQGKYLTWQIGQKQRTNSNQRNGLVSERRRIWVIIHALPVRKNRNRMLKLAGTKIGNKSNIKTIINHIGILHIGTTLDKESIAMLLASIQDKALVTIRFNINRRKCRTDEREMTRMIGNLRLDPPRG